MDRAFEAHPDARRALLRRYHLGEVFASDLSDAPWD